MEARLAGPWIEWGMIAPPRPAIILLAGWMAGLVGLKLLGGEKLQIAL